MTLEGLRWYTDHYRLIDFFFGGVDYFRPLLILGFHGWSLGHLQIPLRGGAGRLGQKNRKVFWGPIVGKIHGNLEDGLPGLGYVVMILTPIYKP